MIADVSDTAARAAANATDPVAGVFADLARAEADLDLRLRVAVDALARGATPPGLADVVHESRIAQAELRRRVVAHRELLRLRHDGTTAYESQHRHVAAVVEPAMIAVAAKLEAARREVDELERQFAVLRGEKSSLHEHGEACRRSWLRRRATLADEQGAAFVEWLDALPDLAEDAAGGAL